MEAHQPVCPPAAEHHPRTSENNKTAMVTKMVTTIAKGSGFGV